MYDNKHHRGNGGNNGAQSESIDEPAQHGAQTRRDDVRDGHNSARLQLGICLSTAKLLSTPIRPEIIRTVNIIGSQGLVMTAIGKGYIRRKRRLVPFGTWTIYRVVRITLTLRPVQQMTLARRFHEIVTLQQEGRRNVIEGQYTPVNDYTYNCHDPVDLVKGKHIFELRFNLFLGFGGSVFLTRSKKTLIQGLLSLLTSNSFSFVFIVNSKDGRMRTFVLNQVVIHAEIEVGNKHRATHTRRTENYSKPKRKLDTDRICKRWGDNVIND
mmetsp:Transcript_7974/g.13235  ORF Transcript_7974/g.13235 Transcript_7974/m.13235 type:complete len:269 (+) Transcript_7974:847-1653(+)